MPLEPLIGKLLVQLQEGGLEENTEKPSCKQNGQEPSLCLEGNRAGNTLTDHK